MQDVKIFLVDTIFFLNFSCKRETTPQMDCYFWYLIYENKTNYEYDMKTVQAALTKLECKNKKPAICCKEGSLRPWEPKPSFCPLLEPDKRKKREISSGTFHLNFFCTI